MLPHYKRRSLNHYILEARTGTEDDNTHTAISCTDDNCVMHSHHFQKINNILFILNIVPAGHNTW
jgi:hypothetical protein